jgi:hypothetical protein
MSVGNQISQGVAAGEHSRKKAPVLISRLENAHAGLVEPAPNPFNGLLEREWATVETGIGPDPDEGVEHGPTEPNWLGTAQLLIPPIPGCLMVLGHAVLGVKQGVCIHENHE